METVGFAGSNNLIPLSSSCCLMKNVFRKPAAAFANIVEIVFESISFGPLSAPTERNAKIYRSPKETVMLDKVAPK